MRVLIDGLEMPKPKLADMATVYHAYVLVSPNGHASIVVDNEDGSDSTEYPLFPVPSQGRLIDADAFIGTIRPLCEEDKFAACTFETVKRLMVEHINNAPTIIPADHIGDATNMVPEDGGKK